MSETINLYDAKTNLSKLVDHAAAGEEIVIALFGAICPERGAGAAVVMPHANSTRVGYKLALFAAVPAKAGTAFRVTWKLFLAEPAAESRRSRG